MKTDADIVIYCTPEVRKLWPQPLARRWHEQYPNIFDRDDLRLTTLQTRNHFCEWFTAIHLFQSRGVLSLIEKYRRGKAHPWKKARYERLFSETERLRINQICADCRVQPPDLLTYAPDLKHRGFVEVKGPGDRLSDKQVHSHTLFAAEFKLAIEVIEVRVEGAPHTSRFSGLGHGLLTPSADRER